MKEVWEKGKWRFAVDRGGTFTDVIGVDPAGRFHTEKLLSSAHGGDPCIEGIRRVLGLQGGALPEGLISSIRFGTTVATNALLERKGGRVGLIVTRGFADLFEIGSQARPELFSLCITKPSQLYSSVVEVDERVGPDGSVEEELDGQGLNASIQGLKGRVDAVAVVLLHSWKNPAHELKCERLLSEAGITPVFLSHKSVNLIKAVTRGQSTLVDAYLGPVMARYLAEIERYTSGIPVEFIRSSGGLVPPGAFTGKDAVLSGPAGGVIAVGALAKGQGLAGAIGFDMGGTSTDVSRYDGGLARVYELKVAGVELQGSALDIKTVASGGGSILWFDGQRMRVGPASAGADPGPACYGLGGPLTITDANLFTGRLLKGFFPKTFGPNGSSELDDSVVKDKFLQITGEINAALGLKLSPGEVALGFIEIADEKMVLAIKEISVARGYDPRSDALVSFGGAGGQHACAISARLGMENILFHPLASLMSAYGIGMADSTKKAARTVLMEFTEEAAEAIEKEFEALERGLDPGARSGADGGEGVACREVDLRPLGADTFLTVGFTDHAGTLTRFKEQYEALFGFSPDATPVEAVNLRVELVRGRGCFGPYAPGGQLPEGGPPEPVAFTELMLRDGARRAPVFKRAQLGGSAPVVGPALVVDEFSTLVIDPGYEARAGKDGVIVAGPSAVSRGATPKRPEAPDGQPGPDPVLLEVFNSLFSSVATEMGATLKKTAHSVNIKERLDYSCAVFDAEGGLVANAEHIPVHLGAMAETVKAIRSQHGANMRPGDAFISNNPYRGGSHLPDVTVVEPVFSETGGPKAFVAARGHHADIGGVTPGSMPPEADHIDQEGVLLDGELIVRDGRFLEAELRELLTGHRYPARNIPERVSDVKAGLSACSKGVSELKGIAVRYGWDEIEGYMLHVQKNAEFAVKKALARFLGSDGDFHGSFTDWLDDGTPICARVAVSGGSSPPGTVTAVVDFTGTGPAHAGDNLNAPLPVTRSAVLYVLRTLIEEDVPLNEGCFRPVEIIVPEGTLLNPVYPAPVGSGNVETSQRVVDVLLGAFGVAAASQGTMNNLLFEVDGEPPYYETIAGGAGGVQGCPGASGVQVHMTNTRITDPEVLETRHPGVRVESFSVRRGSGGEGLFRGGDGVVRVLRFLKGAEVSIISERRRSYPYGVKGGGPGRRGKNTLVDAAGVETALGHRATVRVAPGTAIQIKTPGGGGYGRGA